MHLQEPLDEFVVRKLILIHSEVDHPHADTINLLLSVGEAAVSAINSNTPVSPVPYAVSQEFRSYTLQALKWNYTVCHLYIGYYQFLNDYPVFIYSGLPWTTIRYECNRWKKWLDSDEARRLPTSDYTSSSFWKGALPTYRENQPESSNSPANSHSFEDDTQDSVEYESEIVISTSLSNLNI